jgi:hypothetical protein
MNRRILVLGLLVLASLTAMVAPAAARPALAPRTTTNVTLEGCIAFCGGSANVQTYDASGVCICKGATLPGGDEEI